MFLLPLLAPVIAVLQVRYDSPPGKALLERLKCEQEQQLLKLKEDMAFQVSGRGSGMCGSQSSETTHPPAVGVGVNGVPAVCKCGNQVYVWKPSICVEIKYMCGNQVYVWKSSKPLTSSWRCKYLQMKLI